MPQTFWFAGIFVDNLCCRFFAFLLQAYIQLLSLSFTQLYNGKHTWQGSRHHQYLQVTAR